MGWGEQQTLGERFVAVCDLLKEACPHWQLGTSYEGWVDAHRRERDRLVPLIVKKLREHMRELAEQRSFGRWEVYAVDGSDGACPRTKANQEASSNKGQIGGMPLLSMTVMHHVNLGLPWDFRVGPSTESERMHLWEMIDNLPQGALLVADAGFIGYECCRQMIEKKQHFLLRVGGNVNLWQDLGCGCEVDGETVYLWPLEQQEKKQPPIQLRLIIIREPNKQPIYLVTSVLDAHQLTLEESHQSYYARWSVELFYRDTKQTLGHDGVQSRIPTNSYMEMTWALLSVWVLKLMTLRQIDVTNVEPRRVSVAQARDVVRRAMRNHPRLRLSLAEMLAACQIDPYARTTSKASRGYPRKKRHKPPQPPKIKLATQKQRQLTQSLTPLSIAN